jgi:hypothetical protein
MSLEIAGLARNPTRYDGFRANSMIMRQSVPIGCQPPGPARVLIARRPSSLHIARRNGTTGSCVAPGSDGSSTTGVPPSRGRPARRPQGSVVPPTRPPPHRRRGGRAGGTREGPGLVREAVRPRPGTARQPAVLHDQVDLMCVWRRWRRMKVDLIMSTTAYRGTRSRLPVAGVPIRSGLVAVQEPGEPMPSRHFAGTGPRPRPRSCFQPRPHAGLSTVAVHVPGHPDRQDHEAY